MPANISFLPADASRSFWRNPHFLLFLSAVIWGLTWPAGRVVALNMPPITSASWRFTLAALPMLLLVYRSHRGWPRLERQHYHWLALAGVVGVYGYMVCFMWGLSQVPAGRGSLVIAINPVLTAIGAAIFLRERITRRMLLGMVLAIVGALTVITQGRFVEFFSGGLGYGEIILLGCSVSWAIYSLMSKRSMAFTDTLTATTYPIVVGTVLLLLTAPLLDRYLVGYQHSFHPSSVPWVAWLSLLFLAWGATVLAYSWFFGGVHQVGPTTATAYNTLVPIFGVFFSWLLLQESMDWSLLIGGAIAIAGLAIMNGLGGKSATTA